MQKLPLSFALLTYSGYWRPTKWPVHSIKYWLYNGYSAFMILFVYSFTFFFFIDCLRFEDMKTAVHKFSLFISVLGVCIKVTNLFCQRDKIINMVNTLVQGNYLPKDEDEVIIQQKFDLYARNLTIYCEILNESTAVFATVAQFNEFISTRTLPAYERMPFSLESTKLYLFSLLFQSFSLIICANSSVANETLISGLMIQVSAQLEIFCHRARNLPALITEAKEVCTSMEDFKRRRISILGDLVKNHLEIYDFATIVNTIFQYTIFAQFCISATVVCLCIYTMSTEPSFNINFVWSFSYLCSMLMQVYLYCWYGNEVALQSKSAGNAIYEMDWTTLPISVMKDLLIIMARSSKPIVMSSGHVVTLSADSFMAIMKMSYSSYNLLKDTSNK
ncbi:odorant receptor 67a [Colletes latitarsis]|uniref:odorant receptor 67a n=1 Tax=Colletes latitarsis TaxID=2605962 RepID=UPI0040351E9E